MFRQLHTMLHSGLAVGVSCIALGLLGSALGCRGKEAPPTPDAARIDAKPSPSVNTLLRLAPPSAVATTVVRNPDLLYQKTIALSKRLVSNPQALDEALQGAVARAAAAFKVPECAGFSDIALAKGLDPQAPVALFVDLEPMVRFLQEQAASAQTQGAPKPEAATPTDGAAAGAAPETPVPSLPKKRPLPTLAVAAFCRDSNVARASVQEAIAEMDDLKTATPKETDVAGIHIVTYAPDVFSYFIAGDILVMGNSSALVSTMAERFQSPPEVNYGTDRFPASDDDQVIQLLRLDHLTPLATSALPPSLSPPFVVPAATSVQLDLLRKRLAAYAGDEPMVITFSWTDSKMEVLTRVALQSHPNLAKASGPAQPLRLAAFLPEETQALLSIRCNDEFKAGLLGVLSPETQSKSPETPAVRPTTAVGQLVASMVSDELSIGLTGEENGLPKAVIMVALANAEQTKGFIREKGVPFQPEETYAGVDLLQVPALLPTPIYFAFPADTLLVANDLEQLKSSIDRLQSGVPSGLFRSFTPAFDAATPRYGALLVRSSIVDQLIKPTLAHYGAGSSPEETQPLEKVAQVVRELRFTQDVYPDRHEGHFTLFLN